MSIKKAIKSSFLSALAFCPVARADEIAIGTFDSRAVAMAMARGDSFKKKIAELKTERDEAEAKDDKKRVAELEKEGPAIQEQLHRQVFGNEPIDDVLALVQKDLPGIAEAAGVKLLISKWEIAYQGPGVRTIDVTWELVNLFKPDDQTKKHVKELLKTEPVPAGDLKHEH